MHLYKLTAFLFFFLRIAFPTPLIMWSFFLFTNSATSDLSFSSFMNSLKYSYLFKTLSTLVNMFPFISFITLTYCLSLPARSLYLARLFLSFLWVQTIAQLLISILLFSCYLFLCLASCVLIFQSFFIPLSTLFFLSLLPFANFFFFIYSWISLSTTKFLYLTRYPDDIFSTI